MATRRTFLMAMSGALGLARGVLAAEKKPQAGGAPTGAVPAGTHVIPEGSVPTRELGRTSERVSIIGLGGYHLGVPSEAEALRIVHRALDRGVTFFDNCWDYNGGESEPRLGKALADGRRKRAFVMTKLDGRTARGALLQRTAPFAEGGRWERFKTTSDFDGTEQHKHWLTEAKI